MCAGHCVLVISDEEEGGLVEHGDRKDFFLFEYKLNGFPSLLLSKNIQASACSRIISSVICSSR